MKHLLLSMACLLMSNFLIAQAPYTGGAGDGYSSTGAQFIVGIPPVPPLSVDIGLEEGPDGPAAVLLFEGLTEPGEVFVYDLLGKELVTVSIAVQGSHREVIPLPETASAVYLFKITFGSEQTFTRKILNPYRRNQ